MLHYLCNEIKISPPLLQEETGRFKKQCEDIAQELNAAIRERNGLKQQCTAAIRQWDIALRERNEYREALSKVSEIVMLCCLLFFSCLRAF